MKQFDESGLTVIIPAYNEEKGIAETIISCINCMSSVFIIVVNDGSTDGTKMKATSLCEKYKNIRLINNERNLGYGGALKKGFVASKTKYIAFMDAEGTYPSKYIPVLLRHLIVNNLDFVWGNRFGKNERCKMPLVRKVSNKVFAGAFALFTKKHVPDICSGMRVFTKEAIEKIDYETLPDGLDMIAAMSKRIIWRGLKFDLLPISYNQRIGKSKLNPIVDSFRMIRNAIFEK